MELTEKIVTETKLTTLMITHNMRDAIHYGNRLIMLHEGASSSTSPARRRKSPWRSCF